MQKHLFQITCFLSFFFIMGCGITDALTDDDDTVEHSTPQCQRCVMRYINGSVLSTHKCPKIYCDLSQEQKDYINSSEQNLYNYPEGYNVEIIDSIIEILDYCGFYHHDDESLLVIQFECEPVFQDPDPMIIPKYCFWAHNDGSNCKSFVGACNTYEYLTAFENNECCEKGYSCCAENLIEKYPNGYPVCFETYAEAHGCFEYYIRSFSYDGVFYDVGGTIVEQFCLPFSNEAYDEALVNATNIINQQYNSNIPTNIVDIYVETRCLP